MNFRIGFFDAVFVILVPNRLEAKLNDVGNHTCLVPETYKQYTTVGRDVKKPKTVTSFCWDIKQFFRCTSSIEVTERVYENTPITRTRLVVKCCTGYIKHISGSCIPFCWPVCRYGECVAPNKCSCFAGYHGAACVQKCPPNRWGHYCSEECQCLNEAECNFKTGNCSCQPGWRGSRCELFCEDGYYGAGCQEKCNCPDEICDPQTGGCLSTTTESDFSTDYTSTQSYNFETVEESTISNVNTTTTLLENDSLLYLRKNGSQQTSTAVPNLAELVTYDDSLGKYEEESSTVVVVDEVTYDGSLGKYEEESHTVAVEVVHDVITKTSSEVSILTTQVKEVQLEPASTTEIANEANVTKGTVSIEETSHAVKILKNLESDRRNNNASDFVESETKENESKFTDETRKNYANEIRKNGLIENATPGEFVTIFSKEIEMENDGGLGNQNYASERESNSNAFQFIPSLTVLLGVSVVIIVIGARWLIANHRKRKLKLAKVKEDKLFNPGNLKYTESVYTANSFFEEPINMSDLNFNTNEPPPVLLTFKPEDT